PTSRLDQFHSPQRALVRVPALPILPLLTIGIRRWSLVQLRSLRQCKGLLFISQTAYDFGFLAAYLPLSRLQRHSTTQRPLNGPGRRCCVDSRLRALNLQKTSHGPLGSRRRLKIRTVGASMPLDRQHPSARADALRTYGST